jgi:hypothetical protein
VSRETPMIQSAHVICQKKNPVTHALLSRLTNLFLFSWRTL